MGFFLLFFGPGLYFRVPNSRPVYKSDDKINPKNKNCCQNVIFQDGCNYLCRCTGSGYNSNQPYEGVADDQLDDEIDDEHLLPM